MSKYAHVVQFLTSCLLKALADSLELGLEPIDKHNDASKYK